MSPILYSPIILLHSCCILFLILIIASKYIDGEGFPEVGFFLEEDFFGGVLQLTRK